MALLSNANFQKVIDRMAAGFTQMKPTLGVLTGNPVAGTVRGTLANMLTDIVGFNDFNQEQDLSSPVNVALGAAPFESSLGATFAALIAALNKHCFGQGPTVAAAIIDLNSYLSYYNATPFTVLATPDFADLYNRVIGSAMAVANVMSPAIQPDYNSSASAHGLGDYDIASTTYTQGDQVGVTSYLLAGSPVVPVIEVVTAFVGGSSPPAVNISGTDDQGNACTLNAAVTLTGNNPAGPLSGITVTPSISVAARQTVALSSVTGIVAGSILEINKNKPDQEFVVVESVNGGGSTITAVFRLAHAASATVDGWNSYLAGNLSTGAGRRLAKLAASSGITLTLHSHTAGKVRIAGQQDRVSV